MTQCPLASSLVQPRAKDYPEASIETRSLHESSTIEHFVYTVLQHFSRRVTFGRIASRGLRDVVFFSAHSEVQICVLLMFSIYENHGVWSEMGSYGSIWAHVKTGKSHISQDYFGALPVPTGLYRFKHIPTTQKVSMALHPNLVNAAHFGLALLPNSCWPCQKVERQEMSWHSDGEALAAQG